MDQTRHPIAPVATPGASESVTLYQDGDGTAVVGNTSLRAAYTGVRVAFYLDQAVTLTLKWGPTLTTTDANLVTADTVSCTASTWYGFVIALQPGRNKIVLTAGGTAPTASFIAVEYSDWPNLALAGTILSLS